MADGITNVLPSRRLRPNFYPATGITDRLLDGVFRSVFFDPESMTELLRELSDPNMQVEVLQHAYSLPRRDEAELLKVHNEPGLVREVLLHCQNQPWIYARSFFPRSLVKAHGNHFARLGTRPLGELLFGNPEVVRSEFSVAKLRPGHLEYHDAVAYLPEKPRILWARRSTFHLPAGKLVLTEVFLPAMLAGLL